MKTRLIGLAALASAGGLFADTAVELNENDDMERISVVYPLRSPGQTQWHTQDLASGRDTGDLLRDLPGVSGSRMGGHGIDPVIRGLGQTRINVLLDGAFVHGACPNRMDPPTAYAPAAGYDLITIMRGVTTLEYGGGPGGTVLLERDTERFTAQERQRALIAAGYRDNASVRDLSADLATGTERGFVRAFGSLKDARNYQDGDGNAVRSAFEERSAGAVLGWTPSDERRLEISAEAQRLRDELFAGAGMDSPKSDNDLFRIAWRDQAVGPFDGLRAELAISRVDHVMDNYTLRTPMNPMMLMRAPATSDTDSGRVVGEIERDTVLWRMGLSLQNNRREATRVNDANGMLQSQLWPDAQIDQAGLFAEAEWSFAERHRLIGGLRLDRVHARANRVDTQPGGMFLSPRELYAIYYGEDADGSRVTESNLGGLLRLEHDLARPGTVYLALSSTVRTADATERYFASNAGMPSGRWVGNPGLDPERHWQLETGLLMKAGEWELDGSIFYNRVDNYILRDRFRQPGNNATVYRNVDATFWGGELGLAYRWAERWRADVGLAYVRARNDSANRQPLAQTPPLEALFELSWQGDEVEAFGRLRAAARQSRIDDNPLVGTGLDTRATPGWAVFDLGLRYRISDQWSLDAGIDNLLDRQYAQHLNRSSAFDVEQVQVNEPGRSAWLKLAWRYP